MSWAEAEVFGVDPLVNLSCPPSTAELAVAAFWQVLQSRMNDPRVHQILLSSCWEMNTKPAVLSEV